MHHFQYLNNQTDEQQNAVINEEPEEDHHQQDEVANIDEPMETEDTETPFNRTFTVEEAGDETQNRSIREFQILKNNIRNMICRRENSN